MVRRVLIALATAGLIAACRFSPEIADGTIRCGASGACPTGFVCATDGLCRKGQVADGDLGSEDAAADLAVDEDLAMSEDLAGVDLTGADLSSSPDMACIKAMCPGNGCGTMLDGCGGKLVCGSKTCGSGKTCGAKVINQCGPGSCTPIADCGAAGKNCGLISNGCDDVIDCGTCATGSCGGGGVLNVCG